MVFGKGLSPSLLPQLSQRYLEIVVRNNGKAFKADNLLYSSWTGQATLGSYEYILFVFVTAGVAKSNHRTVSSSFPCKEKYLWRFFPG